MKTNPAIHGVSCVTKYVFHKLQKKMAAHVIRLLEGPKATPSILIPTTVSIIVNPQLFFLGGIFVRVKRMWWRPLAISSTQRNQ